MAVTVSDVAARAGVSRASVSYAFTQPSRLSAETLAKVLEAVEELGYVGNDAARQLRVGRSRALALILPNPLNPVFADIAMGAERAARERGRYVFVGNSNDEEAREREYIDFFEQQRVGGVLIAPVAGVTTQLEELERRRLPFVVIGDVGESHPYDSVTGNDERGGQLAVEHLVAQGRSRLLVVTGPAAPIRGRIRGAVAAARRAGVRIEHLEVEQQSIADGDRIAARLLHDAPDDLPDGIFAGNDLLALGMLQHFVSHGVDVPDRLSLVGYDDIPFSATAIVALTSVRQPVVDMGRVATEVLLERIESSDAAHEPQQIKFDPTLSVRGTSR